MPTDKTDKTDLSPELSSALQTAIINNCMASGEVKKASAQIPEGTKVAFDINVNVKGVLTRGEGYESKPTSILLTKVVIARLLRNLGATRESAKAALRDAAMAALAAMNKVDGKVSDILLEEDRQLLLTLDEVDRDILSHLPKPRKNGALKVAATTKFTKVKLEPQLTL